MFCRFVIVFPLNSFELLGKLEERFVGSFYKTPLTIWARCDYLGIKVFFCVKFKEIPSTIRANI